MNRNRATTALLATLLLACSACLAGGAENGEGGAPSRTLTTTGTATVEAAPDRARFVLEVETTDKVAERCAERNAEASDAVMKAVKRVAGAQGTVTTDSYSLSPRYSTEIQGGVRRQVLDGYSARHAIAVVTADLEIIGALMDAAVGTGATGVGAVNFYIEDTDPLRRKALSEAGERAKADAVTLAESLDVDLGRLISASHGGPGLVIPRPLARAESLHGGLAAAATPVEPGDVKLSVTVTAVFEID